MGQRDEFSFPGQPYEYDEPRSGKEVEDCSQRLSGKEKPVIIEVSGINREDVMRVYGWLYPELVGKYANVDFQLYQDKVTFFCLPHEMEPEVISKLKRDGFEVYQTGSRVICKQPPADSDDDWVLLDLHNGTVPVPQFLAMHGYKQDVWHEMDDRYGDAEDRFPVASWRNEKVNIIVTHSPRFFDLTKLATDIARRFNIRERDERVWLFHAIRGGVSRARD